MGDEPALAMPDPRAVALAGVLALVLLVARSLRVVRVTERLVVLRLGRRPRLRGPGLVAVLPGVDRTIRVPLETPWYDVTWLDATTRDGVRVTVTAGATGVVVDPVVFALAGPTGPAVAQALEAEIRRGVAARDLAALATSPTPELPEVPAAATVRTARWGIAISEVEIGRIETRVDGDLVRWAGGPR